jgi:hypothetical protein
MVEPVIEKSSTPTHPSMPHSVRRDDPDLQDWLVGWRRRHCRVCVWKTVYRDSSERLNDSMVRARSLLANSAATGFINRIKPKR